MEPELKFDGVDAWIEAVEIEASTEAATGMSWPARLIKSGFSLNLDPSTGLQRYYTSEFLQANAAAFDNAPMYMSHEAKGPFELVGKTSGVRFDNGALVGNAALLRTEETLAAKITAAREAGVSIPLSIRAFIAWNRGTREGKDVAIPQRLIPGMPVSVDFVKEAGAGGQILATAASSDTQELLAAVRKVYVKAAPTAEQKEQQMETIEKAPAAGVTKEELAAHAAQSKSDREAVEAANKQTQEALLQLKEGNFRTLLTATLEESKLPKPSAELIRSRFIGADGKVTLATAEELTAQVKSVRDAFAAVVPGPHRRSGGPALEVGLETQEKIEIALDRLFGIKNQWKKIKEGGLISHEKGAEVDRSVPSFEGIAQAYVQFTGDTEIRWYRDGATKEDWDSSSFTNALANTLYRRIIQDYREVDFGLDLICPNRQPHRMPLKDFRSNEIDRVGYLADLPLVDPEVADWPEIAQPSDEKATLQAVQFGGIVSVTRKTILNDDIGLVVKVASRLARSAHRTLARRLFNFCNNNPAIYDALALYHATHANVGTTAISATEFDVIRTAMMGYTEKDSAELLGIMPYMLFVPPALYGKAIQENNRAYLDGNFTPNPAQWMFGKPTGLTGPDNGEVEIGGIPERVKMSVLLTAATKYFVFADPDIVQTFQIGFLQGRTEPELLVADNQLVGKAFTADRIQYKVRHEYEVTAVDFRGTYKDGN